MKESNEIIDISRLHETIEANFPSLWPAVDLCLATAATLLLAENVNPTAVILVGGPAAGKTTVASMFEGADVPVDDSGRLVPLVYRSDKFTPASFVSQAANRTAAELDKVDLLPRITNRVLLTPELAPIFRGDDDQLTERFATITRVLDGHGYKTDSGTHGGRGYSGRYVFAWIGCTTPFPARVWHVMSQLGSRLFFLLMEAEQSVSVDDLLAGTLGKSYDARHRECKAVVHAFLRGLFSAHSGVSSVMWNPPADEQDAAFWLARCAVLLAAMRSIPTAERDGTTVTYRPGLREQPHRAHAVLTNVARGHALVHGRSSVTIADVPLMVRVAVSSMPGESGRIFRALAESDNGLNVDDVRNLLGVKSPETARERMRYMDALDVAAFDEPGVGKEARLALRPGWAWCASPAFRALLRGEPVSGEGSCEQPEPVTAGAPCLAPITTDLVESLEGGGK